MDSVDLLRRQVIARKHDLSLAQQDLAAAMATTSDDAGDGKDDDESSGQRTGPSFASASLDARDAADGDVEEGLIMPCAGAADAQGRGPFQVWIKEFNGQRYTITCDSKFTVPAPNLVVRAHNAGDLPL